MVVTKKKGNKVPLIWDYACILNIINDLFLKVIHRGGGRAGHLPISGLNLSSSCPCAKVALGKIPNPDLPHKHP